MAAPALKELAPDGRDPATNPCHLYAALRTKVRCARVLVPESGACRLVVPRDAARAAPTDRVRANRHPAPLLLAEGRRARHRGTWA
ncbi:hypothetical protein ACFS5L_40895 [Streptomyces phyllanthi]|uniref:Uncharacterized protein n=1 Tax=Streptomyces phyllanthi TaxID=1803180 RepID=A0A5N8W7U0_9ACTN|nr:hypothetical protein [Streptomyces phyllanthi]MPY42956.1 hypothetical protein [Streptomyces phyllanthi]